MREVLAMVLTCVRSAAARAQDPVEVDPAHYKVAFENDCVRVLRVHYDAAAKSVMHSHPDLVAVPLTNAQFEFSESDGSVQKLDVAGGDALWAPGGSHLPKNAGAGGADLVLVELKPNRSDVCQPAAGAATEAAGSR